MEQPVKPTIGSAAESATEHAPLRDWRMALGISVEDMARRLNMARSPRALARIECGVNGADADMIERIVALTDGAVTAQDMHETRLAWLKANRPDKFDPAFNAAVDDLLRRNTGAAEPEHRP